MKLTMFIGAEHRPTESLTQRMREHAEQVRLARQLGYDSVAIGFHMSYGTTAWFPPIETLMRLAPEAEGMSLATCMVVLPQFQPLQVAEQFALLDATTGGRAIIGTAPGWTREEFELLGIDYASRFGRYAEALTILKRLYTEERVTFEGKHFRVRNASLALKPTRKPRPPMWFGGSVENAVKRAATFCETELGDTWVASAHLKTDVVIQQAKVFRSTLADLGKPPPSDFPLIRNIVVAPDRATAIREVGPAIAESYKIFGNWGLFTDVVGDKKSHPEFDDLIGGRFIIGSPEEAAEEFVRIFKASGCNRIIVRCQWVGAEQRHVLRTMELMTTKVRPLVEKAMN